MGRKIPTLGYPSRTEAVMGLRDQGLNTRQIADRIGINVTTVSALECSATRSAERQRRPSEAYGRTVVFPVDVLHVLRPHAARRGITVNQLARDIVSAVVDDDLVTAVLDDGEVEDEVA